MDKIHVIARAYIRDGNYILLADNGKNLFMPGGHVHWNESILSALKRELFEEIGLEDIVINGFIGVTENTWDHKGKPFHETNFIFQVSSPNLSSHPNVASKEDHIKFHWIKFDELEQYNFLPENISEFLNGYEMDKKVKFQTTLENKIL